MTGSMVAVAKLIKTYDAELRKELATSRSGLFRNDKGDLYIQSNVPLGQGYKDEVIGIFADTADLDFYYKMYLPSED